MQIRMMQEGDLGGILPLFEQLWPGKALDPEALARVFAHGTELGTYVYFCAEEARRVVGFCSLAFHNSLWQEGPVAYIEVLVVDESLRSIGIGKQLTEKAIEIARSRGCKKIELDSAFHRERAHTFYERLGFEKRGWVFSRDL